jgi:transposase
MVQKHEVYAKQYKLLTSIPAIGPAVAITLITDLPEMGRLNKKEIASLVGLAPHNRDSGKSTGKATIRTGGGRRCVKAALYVGALTAVRYNPAIRTYYKRLVENGKPKKVALIACMRKLLIIANQMIKEQREWQEDYIAA